MRFISMKHFRSPAAIRRAVMDRETIVLGQIIGEVNGSLTKTGRLPDGSESESIVLLGDFAAVCYETQAMLQSQGKDPMSAELQAEALYMPRWYTEAIIAKLKNNARIEFAAEVLVMPTPEGQTIQYQYDVRSLLARPANSPVERMKRALAANGVLRLSPPVEVKPGDNIRLQQSDAAAAQVAEAEREGASVNPETGEIHEGGDAPEPVGNEDQPAEVGQKEHAAPTSGPAAKPGLQSPPAPKHSAAKGAGK